MKSSRSTEVLDDKIGSWMSIARTNCTIDEADVAKGLFSYKFYSTNITGYMLFGFEAASPLNLSVRFLVLWLKVQNVTLENPLTLTLHDAHGKMRGFWNIHSWFALNSNMWGRVVMDLSNFQWEDPGFDPAQVTRIKFVVYDGGRPYSQTVWIENPTIHVDDENQNYSSNQNVNYSLVLYVPFLLFISYCLGLVVFDLLRLRSIFGGNFAVSLPLYMAIGVSMLVLLLSLSCLAYFDVTVSWCISLVVAAVFFVIIRKDLANFKARLSDLRRIEVLLPLFFFGFSMVNFLRLALDMGWGAYVDSQTHGLFTSLIVFHNGFPSSTYPIGNICLNPIQYPMGFHALSSFVSFMTGAYPGQTILVVATALVSLLAPLFYSLVYLYSKSLKLSILAFLLVFFLPGYTPALWRPSHDLLLGNYIVGTYPNLLGNALLVTFLATIIIITDTRKNDFSKGLIFLFGLLIISLCLTYYALLSFVVAFILMKGFVFYARRPKPNLKKCIGFVALLLVSILSICAILFYGPTISEFLELDSSILHTSYMRYSLFESSSPYFVYGMLFLAAFPFSMWFLFRKRLQNLGLFFFAFFVPLMCSQNAQMFSRIWFVQPDRALILLVAFSYLVLLLGVFELSKIEWLQRRLSGSGQLSLQRSVNLLRWLGIGCVFLLCVPSIVSHLTYSYSAKYKESLPNGNDFKALTWLARNTNSYELIVNDRTVMGLWASSFRALSLVNDREIILEIFLYGSSNDTNLTSKTIELNEVLDYPWNYDGIRRITQRYNVSYIYLSENNLKLPIARGQDFMPFPWSHLTQKERMFMYLQNPDLKVVYRSGNAVVFEVDV